MSKKRLTSVRIFNDQEFRSKFTPRREKILMAMQDERLQLTADDEAYRNLLVQAFAIMSEPNRSMTKIVKMISEVGDITERTAFKVVNDATYVFGNVMEVNRLFLKNMRREALYKIIRKLEDAPKPDYKLILQANELLIKLDDLPKALPQAESEDIQDLTIPTVVFTSNPKALIEEAKYEEE